MALLCGSARAQAVCGSSSVAYTIVANYPVNAGTCHVAPQSSPSGQPYSVTITPGPTGGNWLTTDAAQGATGSSSFNLGVSSTANALAPGQYTSTATVTIGTPSSGQSTINIPATLTVDAEPNLTVTGGPALSGGSFSFGTYTQQTSTPGTQILNVTTASPASGAPATPATFTVTQTARNGNTPANLLVINGSQPFTSTGTTTPVPVSITFSSQVANGLSPGTYGGTVTVTVPQSLPTNPQSVAVPWSLTISAAPTLQATPNPLPLNVPATGSVGGTIAVSSSQNIPISVSASSTGWLTVISAPSTANSGSIALTANSAGLQAGQYSGSVTITSPNASNSPLTVPVTLTVLAPSISNVSPSSVVAGSSAFTLTVNGANFVSNSQVVFAGTPLTTTFVNSGSLTASVPASLVANAGNVNVTVVNNGSPSVSSAAVPFAISTQSTGTPTITPPLQSSPLSSNTATLGNSITAGTNISAFKLYINGNFNTDANHTVTWTNTVTNTSTTLSGNNILSVTPTQLVVSVPSSLFSTAAQAGQVNVTVTEQINSESSLPPVTSNPAPFLIAPPLASTGPTLPNAVVGVSYSPTLVNGGTGPIVANLAEGSTLPPGLTLSGGRLLAGTPTVPGNYSFTVNFQDAWNNTLTAPYNLLVTSPVVPVITGLSPSSVVVGGPQFNMTVSGSNFQSGATVVFGNTGISTSFVNSTTLSTVVPASLITNAGPVNVTVQNPFGAVSAPATFTILSKLRLLTTSIPGSLTGVAYSFTLQATGGLPPYSFSITGLPGSLTLNPATGVISGIWNTAGSFTGTITVTDASGQTASAQYSTTVTTPSVPLSIVTATLPQGTVGVGYGATIYANGGSQPYNFTFSGNPPPGLAFSGGPVGALSGTPTTAGKFSFTATVTDNNNATVSQGFTVTIAPAPITVTGSVSDTTVGASLNVKFGATGGVPPYTFSASGSLPPGTTFSNGVLSGTVTATGTFTFTVTATDSAGSRGSQSFTIHVTAAILKITTASLGNGTVGSAYSASLAATGGVPPYTWTASGLPAGLSITAAGVISGTPTTAGTFSVSVTVTDSAGTKASQSYSVTIASGLTVTTASLGTATVGTSYSASLAASGGVPPYSWTATGLPPGLSASASGAISGTPTTAGSYTAGVTVTDSQGSKATASLALTVNAPALTITTTSLGSGTVGTAVSATLAATGGVPPYSWTATGLPPGVTISAGGALSGTPTTPGSYTVAATVMDSAGNAANASLAWTIALPSAPPLTLTGLGSTATSGSQSTVSVNLGSAYPVPVTVTLTLTFSPASGGDDPSVQFSTGGRTATITVPAGQTAGASTVGVQTGTVAGTITITAQMTAAGQNVTPTPPPTTTTKISAAPPVITSVSAAATTGGFTVTIVGYSNTRDMTQGTFTFTAASGVNLQTSTVTVPLSSLFSAWYGSATSAQYGSQFTFTQPFTVSGTGQAVASVAVTLTNSAGTSQSASATVH